MTNSTRIDTDGGTFISGNVNTVGGDFVGRDQAIFTGRDSINYTIHHSKAVDDSLVEPQRSLSTEKLEKITIQIAKLRGRITRLIPAESSLIQLSKLREPKLISNRSIEEVSVSFLNWTARIRTPAIAPNDKREDEHSNAQQYIKQLNEVEAKLSLNLDSEVLSELLHNLSKLTDQVNIHISQLNSLFTSVIYPATTSRELVENLISKIGHREFKDEAKMHLSVLSQLVKRLDSDQLTQPNFDVLSDEAYGAVAIATELEKRRLLVEGLIRQDRSRRNWTVGTVIVYICAIIFIIALVIYMFGTQGLNAQEPLTKLRVPFLGIPWPVLLWSAIGSFAAMVHRFNTNPIYDFGDAVKWMITRPIQGVVLGLALYLLLVSGLFLLTGNVSGTSGLRDEAILVLCFFVGFSDRFADSVFNTLVQKYSSDSKSSEIQP